MLILTYGQSRVFYAMARDGLLPRFFATLHEKFRTPWIGTIILGVVIAIMASLLPISILGDLVSLGTACAFGIVCLSVMYLRTSHRDLERPFRVPLGGGYVTKPVMIAITTVMAFIVLGFFKFFLLSTWTSIGALVVLAVALIWVAVTWKKRTDLVWIGTAPIGGIFFATVMAGPLVEDVFRKAVTGDTIPAYILGGYAILGALIYIGYGYRNSRMGQGLPQIDDDQGAGPGPEQAIAKGLGDGHA
jgi:APA family basic amino acid/polyamine antiporter